MKIVRAVAKDSRVFRSTGQGTYHVTGKARPLSGPITAPDRKSTIGYSAALVTRLNEDWPVALLSADAATRWTLRQLRARSRDLERNGGIAEHYFSVLEANIIGSQGIGVQMKVRERSDRVITDSREKTFLKALWVKQKLSVEKLRREYRKHGMLEQANSLKAIPIFSEAEDGQMSVPKGQLDHYANHVIEDSFKEFCRKGNCDVTGKHSMRDFTRLILRTVARDGDCVLLVYRGYQNRWGIAFQLIEGDYLDDYYNVEQLPNGNRIRMGVEIDRFRRKVAVWLFANNPSDYGVDGTAMYDGRRIRIPILGEDPGAPVQAIHVTRSKRPEETRAVPWIVPAMSSIHMLESYEEAEVTAARVQACKHIFYERDVTAPDGTPLEWEDVNGQLTDEIQPAGTTELPPGVRANLINPTQPNPNSPQFIKSKKRAIATAVNMSYNTLFGDLESVNYSSIRSGSLDEREEFKMKQEWFGDDVFDPMFDAWLQMSILAGAIPFRLSDFDRIKEHILRFRRWSWVDPKNDVETAVMALQNKLTTRSKIIADMSSADFEETIDELDYEEGYIASKENLKASDEDAQEDPEQTTGKDVISPGQETPAAPAVTSPSVPDGRNQVAEAKKSSTQLTLPPAQAAAFAAFSESIIPEDLYTEEEGYGLETEPHITALYGLAAQDPRKVQTLISNFGPIEVEAGELSLFENENAPYDVLKCDISGDDLVRLNSLLRQLPHKNDYPEYKPHLTLAYVKKGAGAKYVGKAPFSGQKLSFDRLTFSRHDRFRSELPLGQKPAEQGVPV